jgi:hypothetical protein
MDQRRISARRSARVSERSGHRNHTRTNHDRPADLISFYSEKLTITIDGEKLDPVPGQTVIAHGPDRNLSVDEIGGIELVEEALTAEL